MAKPQARRVPSDDCICEIDGQEYALHEGEWVEVVPATSVADLKRMSRWAAIQTQIEALKGEPDESVRVAELISSTFEEICDVLRPRILGWNWTDDRGCFLPCPAEDPGVLERLRLEEVQYLAQVVRGESPGEQKNGLKPSPTTSSATAPQPSPV